MSKLSLALWQELANIIGNPQFDSNGRVFREKISLLLHPEGASFDEHLVHVSSTLKVLKAALQSTPHYIISPVDNPHKFDVWLLGTFTVMLANPSYAAIHSPLIEAFLNIVDSMMARQDESNLVYKDICAYLIDLLVDLQGWLQEEIKAGGHFDHANIHGNVVIFGSNVVQILIAAFKSSSVLLCDNTIKLWNLIIQDLANAFPHILEKHPDMLSLLRAFLEIPLEIPMHLMFILAHSVLDALIALTNLRRRRGILATEVDQQFAVTLANLLCKSSSEAKMDLVSVASPVYLALLSHERLDFLAPELQNGILDFYSAMLVTTKSIPPDHLVVSLLEILQKHTHLKSCMARLFSRIFNPSAPVSTGMKRKSLGTLVLSNKRAKLAASNSTEQSHIVRHQFPTLSDSDERLSSVIAVCVSFIVKTLQETTIEDDDTTVLEVLVPSVARHVPHEIQTCLPSLSTVFMDIPSNTMLTVLSSSAVGKAAVDSGGVTNAEVDLQTRCLMGLVSLKNVPYLLDIMIAASRHTNSDRSDLAVAVWKAAPHVCGLPSFWWTQLTIPQENNNERVVDAAAKCIGEIVCSPYSKRTCDAICDCKPYLSNTYDVSVRLSCVRSLRKIVYHCKIQDLNLARWIGVLKILGSAVRVVRLVAVEVILSIFGRLIEIDTNESCTIRSTNAPILSNELRKIVAAKGRDVVDTLSALIRRLNDLDCGEEIVMPAMLRLLADLVIEEDPVLRAVAAEDIKVLARRRNQTTWVLMFPHLSKLSLRLSQMLITAPRIAHDACLVFATSEKDFFQKIMSKLLPQLILASEIDVMNYVANLLDKELFLLCIQELHNILAHMLLNLRDTEMEQENSMAWLLQFLSSNNDSEVSLPTLFRSCVLALASQFAMECGDPVDYKKERAVTALTILYTRLGQSESENAKDASLSAFLKRHFLGILANINVTMRPNDPDECVRTLSQRINAVRSVGELIVQIGQDGISDVIPQILATLQSAQDMGELGKAALYAWDLFLQTVRPSDAGPILAQVAVSLFRDTSSYTPKELNVAAGAFAKVALSREVESYLPALPALPAHSALQPIIQAVDAKRSLLSLPQRLAGLISAIKHESQAVVAHALRDLYQILIVQQAEIQTMILAEVPDPALSTIFRAVLDTLAQHTSASKLDVGLLCCECIGAFGAFDPARLEVPSPPLPAWEAELEDLGNRDSCIRLAFSLLPTKLVSGIRSGAGTMEQGQYSFAIQEVLRFVGFNRVLVEAAEHQVRASSKLRQGLAVKEAMPPLAPTTQEFELRDRWNRFPAKVQNTLRPLLSSKYLLLKNPVFDIEERPIYPARATYAAWVRDWTGDLAKRVTGTEAQALFQILLCVIRHAQDVSFVAGVLPHLVLNRIVFGGEKGSDEIFREVISVLQDEEREGNESQQETEKRQIATQTIFALMDHLTRWLRHRRIKAAQERALQARRAGRHLAPDELPDSDVTCSRVSTFLNRIPQALMAETSRRASAHARALMHAERHLRVERDRILPPNRAHTDLLRAEADAILRPLYADLQRAYALVDEPDAMEGLVLRMGEPSVHQELLEHETAGRWTAAQTCYEMIMQETGEALESHLGLINCLKNLGHLETALIHVEGAINRNPSWTPVLVSSGVDAAWKLGSWTILERLLDKDHQPTFDASVGSLLLAARLGNMSMFKGELKKTRESLVAPLVAASMESVKRAYDTITKLHMLYEIESTVLAARTFGAEAIKQLMLDWESRLACTVPTLRVREPLLNLRRVLIHDIGLFQDTEVEAGRLWLATAAQARKANIYQASYAALLHAARLGAPNVHLERAKWLHGKKDIYRAMQELSSVLTKDGPITSESASNLNINVDTAARDVLIDETNEIFIKAKTHLLLARWMEEASGSTLGDIKQRFNTVIMTQPNWEKGHFYLGRFFNKMYEQHKDMDRKRGNGTNSMSVQLCAFAYYVCKYYGTALVYGAKYIYQTMPKMLTVWLDYATCVADMNPEQPDDKLKRFMQLNSFVRKLVEQLPAYQFFTAYSQLVSRIGHRNKNALQVLQRILLAVLVTYPRQALWHLMMISKSVNKTRSERIVEVFNQVKNDPSARNPTSKQFYQNLTQDAQRLTEGLLEISQRPVGPRQTTLSMSTDFRNLQKMVPSQMIVPLQSAMTVILPSSAKTLTSHNPFPADIPRIDGFLDEIDVMSSLQKPRKITMIGSDGRRYMFLCKPKDDLRKDARLAEFNSVINKLLKKDPEARKRNLRIRTYAVMPLNEECGLIEWVEGTTPIRHILQKLYKARNIPFSLYKEIGAVLDRKQPQATEGFRDIVIPMFPPVLHEWFIETFPEPTRWLSARSAYAGSCAVMSMVGVIVGLGDRHGENVLLDEQTGEVVHVDFNCLFEKGLTFEKPEKVPFRLTHNMVDAFGVTGVDGAFRKRCEITLRIMRAHNESLRCVLESFVHDPFVEWSIKKKNSNDRLGDENPEAMKALTQIRAKLLGNVNDSQLSIEGHVHELIGNATDLTNLSQMYIGWAAWF
ncbi:hypothetical protein SeMB42_g06371 [Synchytrium endobioticum]|uniref:non-specific serine/threonine protein kinase n=1 Tax=Synchytrium endobioticum TaxID=286115 RepID=A0A507CE56_9FUNG|nr:hypothetical protein SeMB42_g06371 [Synchytrium endobioticum]